MLIYVPKKEHGHYDHGWLETYHHFSFGEYYNPNKRNFGILRVLNDDVVKPESGFPFHPHYDMEIVTYVVEGKLSHKDSMQNNSVLKAGDAQVLSTGIGAFHSETNSGDTDARYIQIWITPTKLGHVPSYQAVNLEKENKVDKWDRIVSHRNGPTGLAPLLVNQDCNIYVIESKKTFDFSILPGRKAYFMAIEGKMNVNNKVDFVKGDSIMAQDEVVTFKPTKKSHVICVEMSA